MPRLSGAAGLHMHRPPTFTGCGWSNVSLLIVGRQDYRTRAARAVPIILIGPGDTNGFFQWVSTCFQPSRGVCVEPLAGRGLTFGPILAEQVHLVSQSIHTYDHKALFVRYWTSFVSNEPNPNNRHQRTMFVDPLRPFRPRTSSIFLRLFFGPIIYLRSIWKGH